MERLLNKLNRRALKTLLFVPEEHLKSAKKELFTLAVQDIKSRCPLKEREGLRENLAAKRGGWHSKTFMEIINQEFKAN